MKNVDGRQGAEIDMEFQAELVMRFFGAVAKPCEWVPWTRALPNAPIGDWVEGPEGRCSLRVQDGLGVDVTPLTLAERAFLRWALSAAAAPEEFEPLAALGTCSTEDLLRAVVGRDGGNLIRKAATSLAVPVCPAHLVAIEWSTGVGGEVEHRESADMVKNVMEAYVEVDAWLVSRQLPLAVASISRTSLRRAWLSLGHEEMDVRGLSALSGQVASALRSEAMIDARVAVSGVIRTPQEVTAGVAMLELARREAARRNGDAAVFGDDPVRMALLWLDEPARDALLRSVAAFSEVSAEGWPEGWGEIAEAMVRSNLNISEAARSLYMHRNTLLARIEKLRDASGLDVRRGADALALFAAGALLQGQSAPE